MFSNPEQLIELKSAFNQASAEDSDTLKMFEEYLTTQLSGRSRNKSINKAINILSNKDMFKQELQRLSELNLWKAAQRTGDKTYHSITPCSTCGSHTRYTCNRGCLACANPKSGVKQQREIAAKNIIKSLGHETSKKVAIDALMIKMNVSRASAYRMHDAITANISRYKESIEPEYEKPKAAFSINEDH